MKLTYAYTESNHQSAFYPGFVNISENDDGSFVIFVRERGDISLCAMITVSKEVFAGLVKAVTQQAPNVAGAPVVCAKVDFLQDLAFAINKAKRNDYVPQTIIDAWDAIEFSPMPADITPLPQGEGAQPSVGAGVPEGWKLVPNYKPGRLVKFKGAEFKVFAYGDRPGTFDLMQVDGKGGTWVNVSPDAMTPCDAPPAPTAGEKPA